MVESAAKNTPGQHSPRSANDVDEIASVSIQSNTHGVNRVCPKQLVEIQVVALASSGAV